MMANEIEKKIQNTNWLDKSLAQKKALKDFFVHSKWKNHSLDIRTLIIHGDQDKIIPVDKAYRLLEKIPNSSIDIQKNCGHLLLAEAYQSLFLSINNFLIKKQD